MHTYMGKKDDGGSALVSSQVAGRGGNEGHKAEEIAKGSARMEASDPRGWKPEGRTDEAPVEWRPGSREAGCQKTGVFQGCVIGGRRVEGGDEVVVCGVHGEAGTGRHGRVE